MDHVETLTLRGCPQLEEHARAVRRVALPSPSRIDRGFPPALVRCLYPILTTQPAETPQADSQCPAGVLVAGVYPGHTFDTLSRCLLHGILLSVLSGTRRINEKGCGVIRTHSPGGKAKRPSGNSRTAFVYITRFWYDLSSGRSPKGRGREPRRGPCVMHGSTIIMSVGGNNVHAGSFRPPHPTEQNGAGRFQ